MGLSVQEITNKFEENIRKLRDKKDSMTNEEYSKKLDVLQKLYIKELDVCQNNTKDKIKLYKPKVTKLSKRYNDISNELSSYAYDKQSKRIYFIDYKMPPESQYLEGEEFKVIPGFEDRYYLSNKGRCWSCPRYVDFQGKDRIVGGCFLKPYNAKGRILYQLSQFKSDDEVQRYKRINVAKYVLSLFGYNGINIISSAVKHKDGDIYNNDIDNLKALYVFDKKLELLLNQQRDLIKFLKQYTWFTLGEGFSSYIIATDIECIVSVNKNSHGFNTYKILNGYLPKTRKYKYYRLINSITGRRSYNSYDYFIRYLNTLDEKHLYEIEDIPNIKTIIEK